MLVKWFHKAIVFLAILMAGTTVRASELEAGLRFHVMINSWNDFSHDSSLEPACEYGETYLDITKRELK